MKKTHVGLPGLMLIGAILTGIVAGQTWEHKGTLGTAVALSADGTRAIASGNAWGDPSFSPVYLSTNGGANWASSGTVQGQFVATSTNGQVLFAVTSGYSGQGWASTNHGAAWQQVSGGYLGGNALSGDGRIAMTFEWSFNPNPPFEPTGCTAWISTNTMASWWAASGIFGGWACGASSTDGRQLLVGGTTGTYRSTNSGVNWSKLTTPAPNPSNAGNIDIACSGDGTKLIGIYGGLVLPPGYLQYPGFLRAVYTSTNSGASWVSNSLPVTNWNAVAISDDGRTLMAVHGNYKTNQGTWPLPTVGSAYMSTDGGTTWAQQALTNCYFAGCAVSADGSKMMVATENKQLYVWQPGLPMQQITLEQGALRLSWPTSAVDVVLQQSSDLTGMNWGDVTNAAITTNGQKVIQLTPTGPQGFFRLRQ